MISHPQPDRTTCEHQRIELYPGDEFVYCQSKNECDYQTFGSDGETVWCDKPINSFESAIRKDERDKVLNVVFASMDRFFGNIPMDAHIIQWAVSKQDSFVTAAMATYLESRKLRQSKQEEL